MAESKKIEKREPTVEQIREMRVLEHEQMILEYIEQVPILRIPAQTHRNVVAAMTDEYNDKYFPVEGDDAEIAEKPAAKKGDNKE